MTRQALASVVIDTLRMVAIVLSVPMMAFAATIGSAAYADFDGRGCAVGEAMQCSDAREAVATAIASLVAGPLIFGILTILRKRVFRKGETHA